MTLEGRFSHGGNIKTFVAAFAVCFMNIWAISKPGMVLWLAPALAIYSGIYIFLKRCFPEFYRSNQKYALM
jgi:hypothetical protein